VTATSSPPRSSPPRPATRSPRRLLGPALALPGIVWLFLFFVAPLYVVLSVVFGGVDPVFRTVIPVWNPILWSSDQPIYVLTHIVGPNGIFGPALLRTAVYVLTASVLCLLIAFPIAYYVARLSGRWKGLLLTLLIAPFWISYMMRMLAWVNLLANDGIVNRVLSLGGVLPGDTEWLSGKSAVVILGLVYGYVPYMIIPLYAGLDRLPSDLIESARDLGANRFWAFWRVTWPMSRPVVVASVLLTCLPMLGDYFTSDLLSGSPSTSMVGNLINNTVLTPGQTGQAGAFVLLVLLVSLLPMIYYVRSVSRNDGALA
jgi:ABC-type spermidine/putrescine transport system permease subunit I